MTGAAADKTVATIATTAAARAGVKVVVRGSDFGRMLWGPKRQALYVFERDRRRRSRCYGACARAWPPLLTKGRPRAGRIGSRSRAPGGSIRPGADV